MMNELPGWLLLFLFFEVLLVKVRLIPRLGVNDMYSYVIN